MLRPATYMVLSQYMAPRVDSSRSWKWLETQRRVRVLLPTPTLPTTTIFTVISCSIYNNSTHALPSLPNINMRTSKSHLSAHPLLAHSQRQFYSRRIPRQQSSSQNLQKVLKLLSPSPNSLKHGFRVTTEPNQSSQQLNPDSQLEHLVNATRFKLNTALKQQPKEWKVLFQGFQNWKKSNSKDMMLRHEVELMNRMIEAMKSSTRCEKRISRKVMGREEKGGKNQLQTILLMKQNQILRQQLNQQTTNVQSEQPAKEQTQQEEGQPEAMNTEAYLALSDELFNVREELCSLKYTNECLRVERGQLQAQIESLKSSNESLCEQIVQWKLRQGSTEQNMAQWRSIMQMQLEEMGGLKRDQQLLRQELKLLHHKYTLTLQRINKLTRSNTHNPVIELAQPQLDAFHEQMEGFQRVRDANRRREYYATAPPSTMVDPTGSTYKAYLPESATANNSSGVKRQHKQIHQYYKPTFYALIEKHLEHIGVGRENFMHVHSGIGINLLCTMRRILDSKHHEYLASCDPSTLTSMPTFALAWLGNWHLNPRTKQPQAIHADLSLDPIANFYLQLMDERLNPNWEAITFRELLLETLTKDEMLFYLKCRFALMKGDSYTGGHYYSQIYWVNLMDALNVVEAVVADLDYRKKMEEYLKRSMDVSLQKKHVIDGHFVLRLLLEYYQFRKSRLISALSKTFSTSGGHSCKHMDFQTFLKLFDYNSFSLTLTSKTNIYQQSFALGRGTVTIDNIFTVLNEEGHFCREAEVMFSKHQQLQEGAVKLHAQQQTAKIQQSFEEYYFNILKPQIPTLGLQHIEQEVQRTIKQNSLQSLIHRNEIAIKVAFLYLKRLFKTRVLSQGELFSLLRSVEQVQAKLTEETVVRAQSWEQIRNVKRNQASRIIYRVYRRKAYYLGLHSMPTGNKYDTAIRNIKKDFIKLVEDLQSKHKIQQSEEITIPSLDC